MKIFIFRAQQILLSYYVPNLIKICLNWRYEKNSTKIQQMPLAVTWFWTFWTQYAHILPESNQIYQNSPDYSISLLSSRGRSSTNTCSISKFLYVLKSYDSNSFISDTFDVIQPHYHTENHAIGRRVQFMKFHEFHEISWNCPNQNGAVSRE